MDRERLLANFQWPASWALGFWIIAGAISLGLAINGAESWIQSIDDAAYAAVVDRENGVFVSLGRLLGFLGSVWVMAPVMLVVAVFLGVRRQWDAFALWVAAIATSQLISLSMKDLYHRPRPPMPLMETTGFSYPSGHSITAAVFAVGLLIIFAAGAKRRPVWVALAVMYVVAMAWSRVYVRAHWLSDVTAGAVIGIALAISVALTLTALNGRTSQSERAGEPSG